MPELENLYFLRIGFYYMKKTDFNILIIYDEKLRIFVAHVLKFFPQKHLIFEAL